MIIQPSFNLKQILEVYPLAQYALEIILAIIITRIITRPVNPIAKNYAKKITKIGLFIALILVITSYFFPDTKNLTATYNKETQNVEQIIPVNLSSKKDQVADFTIHYQNKVENENHTIIRTIYSENTTDNYLEKLTVHFTTKNIISKEKQLTKTGKEAEIEKAFINYDNHITLKMDPDTFEEIVKAMSDNKEVIIEKNGHPLTFKIYLPK